MAITVNQGVNGTPSTVALATSFPTVGSYAYSEDAPGQSIYSNVVNGIDQPNTIRTSVTKVDDVFKKSSARAIPGQNITGTDVLVQVIETWKVTDDGGGIVPAVSWYLPVQARAVFTLPNDVQITDAMRLGLVNRLVGALNRAAADSVGTQLGKVGRGITRL